MKTTKPPKEKHYGQHMNEDGTAYCADCLKFEVKPKVPKNEYQQLNALIGILGRIEKSLKNIERSSAISAFTTAKETTAPFRMPLNYDGHTKLPIDQETCKHKKTIDCPSKICTSDLHNKHCATCHKHLIVHITPIKTNSKKKTCPGCGVGIGYKHMNICPQSLTFTRKY